MKGPALSNRNSFGCFWKVPSANFTSTYLSVLLQLFPDPLQMFPGDGLLLTQLGAQVQLSLLPQLLAALPRQAGQLGHSSLEQIPHPCCQPLRPGQVESLEKQSKSLVLYLTYVASLCHVCLVGEQEGKIYIYKKKNSYALVLVENNPSCHIAPKRPMSGTALK